MDDSQRLSLMRDSAACGGEGAVASLGADAASPPAGAASRASWPLAPGRGASLSGMEPERAAPLASAASFAQERPVLALGSSPAGNGAPRINDDAEERLERRLRGMCNRLWDKFIELENRFEQLADHLRVEISEASRVARTASEAAAAVTSSVTREKESERRDRAVEAAAAAEVGIAEAVAAKARLSADAAELAADRAKIVAATVRREALEVAEKVAADAAADAAAVAAAEAATEEEKGRERRLEEMLAADLRARCADLSATFATELRSEALSSRESVEPRIADACRRADEASEAAEARCSSLAARFDSELATRSRRAEEDSQALVAELGDMRAALGSHVRLAELDKLQLEGDLERSEQDAHLAVERLRCELSEQSTAFETKMQGRLDFLQRFVSEEIAHGESCQATSLDCLERSLAALRSELVDRCESVSEESLLRQRRLGEQFEDDLDRLREACQAQRQAQAAEQSDWSRDLLKLLGDLRREGSETRQTLQSEISTVEATCRDECGEMCQALKTQRLELSRSLAKSESDEHRLLREVVEAKELREQDRLLRDRTYAAFDARAAALDAAVAALDRRLIDEGERCRGLARQLGDRFDLDRTSHRERQEELERRLELRASCSIVKEEQERARDFQVALEQRSAQLASRQAMLEQHLTQQRGQLLFVEEHCSESCRRLEQRLEEVRTATREDLTASALSAFQGEVKLWSRLAQFGGCAGPAALPGAASAQQVAAHSVVGAAAAPAPGAAAAAVGGATAAGAAQVDALRAIAAASDALRLASAGARSRPPV